MRVLIEIVHPANVLFFNRPIRMFKERGDEVRILSRHKDIATDLLDDFGFEHQPVSKAGKGLVGLGTELVQRVARTAQVAREFRPQAMLGFGGVAISHVGRLMKIPSVVFYDTEHAKIQNRLAWPFLSHLTVPSDYTGNTPKGRTSRLPGTKDLSYFHPSSFAPDYQRALKAGLDPDRKNVILRFVSWGSNHDIGKSGWEDEYIEALVERLGRDCKLHVSAEGDVNPILKPHVFNADPSDMHHLMAFCDLVAGESNTMACEAAVLGVPAIVSGVDFPGYVDGLERRGLLVTLRPDERSKLLETAVELLENRPAFEASREAWLNECPDWAEEIVRTTDRLARAPW